MGSRYNVCKHLNVDVYIITMVDELLLQTVHAQYSGGLRLPSYAAYPGGCHVGGGGAGVLQPQDGPILHAWPLRHDVYTGRALPVHGRARPHRRL